MVWTLHAQRVGILVHRGYEALRELMDGFAVLRRALDDLVVDVGDVAHVVHVVTARLQPAIYHVEHHHHSRMAEVAVVVHRHAAHIHADFVWGDRLEVLLVAGEGVVDFEHVGP
jgi:hypothetical protein